MQGLCCGQVHKRVPWEAFPKDMDTDLSKIQGGVMHIVCPLAAAWNSLLEEGVAED